MRRFLLGVTMLLGGPAWFGQWQGLRYLSLATLPYVPQVLHAEQSAWSQHGGSANIQTQGWGENPDIDVDTDGNIWVVSTQQHQPSSWDTAGTYASKIGVAKMTPGGSSFAQIGSPLGRALGTAAYADSWAPDIALIGTTPYVAWGEGTAYGLEQGGDVNATVFVRSWNGATWVALDGARPNTGIGGVSFAADTVHSREPKLKNVGGTLYMIWVERHTNNYEYISAAHWNGSTWVQDGANFSVNTTSGSRIAGHDLFVVNGVPHVVWSEFRRSGTTIFTNNAGVVNVRKLVAGSWTAVGSTIVTGYVDSVTGAGVGTTPYVTWMEKTAIGPYQLHVKHWNGAAWVADGGILNVDDTVGDAGRPSLFSDGTDVRLAWAEWQLASAAAIYTRKLTVSTGTWSAAEGPVNNDLSNGAARSVNGVDVAGIPYMVWSERHAPSLTAQIYVFGRNLTGAGSAPALSLWGSNGSAIVPVTGTWVTATPGGIKTNSGTSMDIESFNSARWSALLGRLVMFGKYHTLPAGSGGGETEQTLLGYSYALNRWDRLQFTEAQSSEHLQSVGHDQGQTAILNNGQYFAMGNLTLSGGWAWRSYAYDLVAGHGKRLYPPTETSLTGSAGCGHDSDRDQVLCLGSRSGALQTPQLYDAATNAWSQVSTGPSARHWPSITYCPVTQKYVVYGGAVSNVNNSETWEYNPALDTWAQITPVTSPGARFGASAAYDSVAQKILMVGGKSSQAWSYDCEAHQWTREADLPAAVANLSVFQGLVYSPQDNVHIFVGNNALTAMYVYRLEDTPVAEVGSARRVGGGQFSGGGVWK